MSIAKMLFLSITPRMNIPVSPVPNNKTDRTDFLKPPCSTTWVTFCEFRLVPLLLFVLLGFDLERSSASFLFDEKTPPMMLWLCGEFFWLTLTFEILKLFQLRVRGCTCSSAVDVNLFNETKRDLLEKSPLIGFFWKLLYRCWMYHLATGTVSNWGVISTNIILISVGFPISLFKPCY